MNPIRERARLVLESPEAEGRRELAVALVLDTDHDPTECRSILASMPQSQTPEAAPAAPPHDDDAAARVLAARERYL